MPPQFVPNSVSSLKTWYKWKLLLELLLLLFLFIIIIIILAEL